MVSPLKATEGLKDLIEASTVAEQERILDSVERRVRPQLPEVLAPGNQFSPQRRARFIKRAWRHATSLFIGIQRVSLTDYLGQSRLAQEFKARIPNPTYIARKVGRGDRGRYYAESRARRGLEAQYQISDKARENLDELIRKELEDVK